jgi:hypothetical protein
LCGKVVEPIENNMIHSIRRERVFLVKGNIGGPAGSFRRGVIRRFEGDRGRMKAG